MGGGDLNVKKSWHVSNFANVEKVWKAEQRDAAEKRKIEELRKEIMEQRKLEELHEHAVAMGTAKKKEERVEFMYAGSAMQVDRDEYLLGRKIDKHVEIESKDDLDIGNAPGAAFMSDAANAPLDLAKKVRDDPLFAIKRKEQEGIKKLMDNPVRMKQLQLLREEQARARSKKKSKKEKKEKKHKKEKKRRSHEKRSRSPDSPYEHHEVDRRRARSRSPPPRPPPGPPPGVPPGHSDADRRAQSESHHERGNSYRRGDRRARSRSRSPRSRRSRSPRSRRSRSPRSRRSRSPRSRRSPSSRQHRSPPTRYRSRSPPSHRRRSPTTARVRANHAPARNEAAEEAERQRKLEEMKSNAAWHDEKRAERARDFAEKEAEQAKRDAQRETDGFGQAAFMKDFNKDSWEAAGNATIADRLARNRSQIQRTTAALDSQSFRR